MSVQTTLAKEKTMYYYRIGSSSTAHNEQYFYTRIRH